MSTTKSNRSISIQYNPFPEELDRNKVLEAGRFLWPNAGRVFAVWCKNIGDRLFYHTGLEPEMYPPDMREEIIQAKEELENHYGKGTLEPDNVNFWKGVKLEINKKTTFLDMSIPEDKLTYYLIKGGGYKLIAPSYDEAVNSSIPKRWYIIDASEYAELGAEDDRKIIKAFAFLQELEDSKSFDDMFLIHKVLVSSDRGATKKTPKALLFKDLSDFLHGRIVKTNKRQTPKQFIEAVENLKKDRKKFTITAYVKDAMYFNFLSLTEDGQFKNLQTGTKYGSSVDKIVQYLSNPANQSELENIKERILAKWND